MEDAIALYESSFFRGYPGKKIMVTYQHTTITARELNEGRYMYIGDTREWYEVPDELKEQHNALWQLDLIDGYMHHAYSRKFNKGWIGEDNIITYEQIKKHIEEGEASPHARPTLYIREREGHRRIGFVLKNASSAPGQERWVQYVMYNKEEKKLAAFNDYTVVEALFGWNLDDIIHSLEDAKGGTYLIELEHDEEVYFQREKMKW